MEGTLAAASTAWRNLSPKNDQRASKRFEQAGRKVDRAVSEASSELEQDAQKLIAYLNDEVVPAVREHSSRGLRAAAQELAKFADYLDRQKKK